MKNTPLILSVISLCAVLVFGILSLTNGGKKAEAANEGEAAEAVVAQEGAIVYFDIDKVVMEYDMANDLGAVVETKIKGIEEEINRKRTKLEKEITSYQEKIQKGLMTRSVAEVQGQKLQQQEIEFNNYAMQKQQEIQEEQAVMMNQIADAIKTFITKYNEEKQYAMILTNSQNTPVIVADQALNITEDVLNGLNEEYIKTKNEKGDK